MAKEMKGILSGQNVEEDDDWEDILAKSADSRGNQENLRFFAFTATPKGKTLESFGHTSEDGAIELDANSDGVSVPTETDTGSQVDEEVELSTIIDRINEKLGTDFTDADQLFLDQLKEDALEDDHLRRSAQVNTRENFALEFDDALTDMFIDRMDQNQELSAKFMDNDGVQDAITKHLRQEVYQESQAANG